VFENLALCREHDDKVGIGRGFFRSPAAAQTHRARRLSQLSQKSHDELKHQAEWQCDNGTVVGERSAIRGP